MGRTLPSVPSRIFRRRPSPAARILRGSLLAFSVAVTLAVLGSSFCLDRKSGALTAATPSASPVIAAAAAADPPPAPASKVASARSVMPAPAGPEPAANRSLRDDLAPAEMPSAGDSQPVSPSVPEQSAALEAPTATVLGDGGDSWVEYGVFTDEASARHLQRALAQYGLASLVVETHAPDGRARLRVRSAALADYDEAWEVAQRAQRALGVGLARRSAGQPERAPSGRGPERY
jgi:SPOR domain